MLKFIRENSKNIKTDNNIKFEGNRKVLILGNDKTLTDIKPNMIMFIYE